jgi:hypothetical protein
MKDMPGDTPRSKVDELRRRYQDKRNITLKEELRVLQQEGLLLNDAQEYFLEESPDTDLLVLWFHQEELRPWAIELRNGEFNKKEVNAYKCLSTIFPKKSLIPALKVLGRVTNVAKWEYPQQPDSEPINERFPTGEKFTEKEFHLHLRDRCKWSRNYVSGTMYPYIKRLLELLEMQ